MSSNTKSSISKADFGKTPDGTPVEIYTLRNSKGAEARIMTYGGIVQKLEMPDKNGNFADVVLGFDTLNGYTQDSYVKGCPYFGALIGRYGNRIGHGKFTLNGKQYTLPGNDNGNTLHGGPKGFGMLVDRSGDELRSGHPGPMSPQHSHFSRRKMAPCSRRLTVPTERRAHGAPFTAISNLPAVGIGVRASLVRPRDVWNRYLGEGPT